MEVAAFLDSPTHTWGFIAIKAATRDSPDIWQFAGACFAIHCSDVDEA
jgi:hypothetical protein